MLKIMLADSDAENLKNFRTYIRLAFPEIKITGSTGSNVNFISQVKENAPDLIIADIRFFGPSAYQTIRDTYEFFPEKRFIVYGTYGDSEYMEKVFEFGVIDYIYRPVKPVDLEKSLHHAIKVFEDMTKTNAEREKLVGRYKVNMTMFMDRFLESLLKGYLTDEREILSSFGYFGINLTPGFSVFTLRIDHFKKIILTMDEMEKHLLVYKILLIINEKLKKLKSGIAVINRLNSISVILGGSVPLFDTVEFCEELRQEILHQTKVGVTIGQGRVYENAGEIYVSCRESEAALRYRHYMGYGTVIPIHFVEPINNITYRYPLEKEERLVYSAVTGEYENCRELLGQIIDALKSCGELPERLIAKIIMDMLFSISRFASEQHIQVDSLFTEYFSSKNVIELKTLDEAYDYMSGALKSFCDYITRIREDGNKEILEKVKGYIREKYYENVALARMAAYAGTTPEFLSNLFQKSEGMSIYRYAITERLKNAKRLLAETDMTDEAVAAKVGYEDVKHFNAVFRQYEGASIQEYKHGARPTRRTSL